MSRFLKAGLRLVLDIAQAIALLPFYAKVLVALGLSAWIVLVADWDEIFPPHVPPPAIRADRSQASEVPAPPVTPVDRKAEDRIPVAAAPSELTGSFTISDPRVGPDGSITNGEDGPPFFLTELKSFSSKDVCTRASGDRWACGLHAYATLRNSIAHKTIQCVNKGSREEPRITCQMGGENLALILVQNGLVELKDDVQDQDLLRAQAKAKAGLLGIWDR